jgi:regulator of sigma E protease
VSIDKEAVERFEDLTKIVRDKPSVPLLFDVERGGSRLAFNITPDAAPGINEYGEEAMIGKIGVTPNEKKAIVYVQSASRAHEWGFVTGDRILKVGEVNDPNWYELQTTIQNATEPFEIRVLRHGSEKPILIDPSIFPTVSDAMADKAQSLGLFPIDMMIIQVEKGSPADKQGLQIGDYIMGPEAAPLLDRFSFSELIQNSVDRPLAIRTMRGPEIQTKKIIAQSKASEKNILGIENAYPYLGIELFDSYAEAEISNSSKAQWQPLGALGAAIDRTIEIGKMTAVGFVKLAAGQLSLKTFGGPIMIFQIAGKSLEFGGLLSFFQMIAVLSISLGLINLLPIPVLDGGHFFFFLIEGIKGSPLNKRIIEIAQQVGLSILLLLMLFTFYNDIMRFF